MWVNAIWFWTRGLCACKPKLRVNRVRTKRKWLYGSDFKNTSVAPVSIPWSTLRKEFSFAVRCFNLFSHSCCFESIFQGTSVTVTSVTDFVAFMVGATTVSEIGQYAWSLTFCCYGDKAWTSWAIKVDRLSSLVLDFLKKWKSECGYLWFLAKWKGPIHHKAIFFLVFKVEYLGKILNPPPPPPPSNNKTENRNWVHDTAPVDSCSGLMLPPWFQA